ncbi:MAG: hypothetical protein ACL93V_13420 [Candidatus Electrothrix sp. YB6]
MLTNKLCYREKQAAKLAREFKAQKEGNPGRSKQKIVQDRFQGNDSKLIKVLTGELKSITVTEIFADLAGPGWKSMLLDRFLLKPLLITPSEDAVPAYSRADEENLMRLARGMNENYLPAPLEALTGHVVPVQTFANVRFLAANEGIAAHVKPGPGPEQEFLRTEFSSRTDSEYTLLFVLAVYQHYRLIDLIRKLAEAVQTSLCKWMKEVLGDKVKEVKPSTRLVDSPAMIVNADGYMTSSMERILAAQGKSGQDNPMMMAGKKEMEINPASPLIKKMADLRTKNQDFAKDVAEQIYDNAMIQAGLLIDPQEMVNRNYRILERMSA